MIFVSPFFVDNDHRKRSVSPLLKKKEAKKEEIVVLMIFPGAENKASDHN